MERNQRGSSPMDNKQHPKYIGARIKAARQAAGFKSAQVFCKKHQIPYQTHSQHVRGIRTPTQEYLKNYSRWLNINEYWLKTGEGEPFTKKRNTQQIEENLTVLETKITEPRANNDIIHKSLLNKILQALLPLKLPSEALATATSDIYSDIVTTEANTELQLKMVSPMIAAYRRFLTIKNS